MNEERSGTPRRPSKEDRARRTWGYVALIREGVAPDEALRRILARQREAAKNIFLDGHIFEQGWAAHQKLREGLPPGIYPELN